MQDYAEGSVVGLPMWVDMDGACLFRGKALDYAAYLDLARQMVYILFSNADGDDWSGTFYTERCGVRYVAGAQDGFAPVGIAFPYTAENAGDVWVYAAGGYWFTNEAGEKTAALRLFVPQITGEDLPTVSYVTELAANYTRKLSAYASHGVFSGMEVRYRRPAGTAWNSVRLTVEKSETGTLYAACNLGKCLDWHYTLTAEFSVYPENEEEESAARCLYRYRYTTEERIVTRDGSCPIAPASITATAAENRVRLSWPQVRDPLYTVNCYRLERSVDNNAYQVVYDGKSTSFTDRLPTGAVQAAYRVAAGYRKSLWNVLYSPWRNAGVLYTDICNVYVRVNGAWRRGLRVYAGKRCAAGRARVFRAGTAQA